MVLREALHRTVQEHGRGTAPLRVLAVAAGPGMELRRWLHETESLERPVQSILLDRDRAAHESAHRQLTRLLLERHHGLLPVTVRCLHFSVRQLVRPRTAEEKAVVLETLGELNLVYSTQSRRYPAARAAVLRVAIRTGSWLQYILLPYQRHRRAPLDGLENLFSAPPHSRTML